MLTGARAINNIPVEVRTSAALQALHTKEKHDARENVSLSFTGTEVQVGEEWRQKIQ